MGCVRCGGMGYRGRTGLYEVMMMSDEIRSLTLERAAAEQIATVALEQGMRRLREDGLEKVKAGRHLDGRGRAGHRAAAEPERPGRRAVHKYARRPADTASVWSSTSPRCCSRSSTAARRTCT